MPEGGARWQPRFSSPRVRALMSDRQGGVSAPPYDSLNLASHVGDEPDAVAENRRRFEVRLGLPLRRLEQVHGATVVVWDAAPAEAVPRADAAVSATPGLACEVQVADCLPVLLADRHGRVVGAAHAGWRGLAGGVLEATVRRCCELGQARPADLEAWLGPCIGPHCFEVGNDVPAGFGIDPADDPCFTARAGVPGKWWADLPGLARRRLNAAGLLSITGNDGSVDWCTMQQPSRYFSFRRDRVTGRLCAAIGLLR